MESEETTRIYVLSKFAQPGLLYRFTAELGFTSDTRFYIATGERSSPLISEGKHRGTYTWTSQIQVVN